MSAVSLSDQRIDVFSLGRVRLHACEMLKDSWMERCPCVHRFAHMQVHVCVFSFCRFTPQELLSFLHRSLIEGRRDQGRGGGEGGSGWHRVGWVGRVGGYGGSLVLHSFK